MQPSLVSELRWDTGAGSLLWDFGGLDPAPDSAPGIDCCMILNKSLPSASVPHLPNGVAVLFLQVFLHTDMKFPKEEVNTFIAI